MAETTYLGMGWKWVQKPQGWEDSAQKDAGLEGGLLLPCWELD